MLVTMINYVYDDWTMVMTNDDCVWYIPTRVADSENHHVRCKTRQKVARRTDFDDSTLAHPDRMRDNNERLAAALRIYVREIGLHDY